MVRGTAAVKENAVTFLWWFVRVFKEGLQLCILKYSIMLSTDIICAYVYMDIYRANWYIFI